MENIPQDQARNSPMLLNYGSLLQNMLINTAQQQKTTDDQEMPKERTVSNNSFLPMTSQLSRRDSPPDNNAGF